jgi:tight adherence protein C
MSSAQILGIAAGWLVGSLGLVIALRSWLVRERARARVLEDAARQVELPAEDLQGPLADFLFRAGLRSSRAVPTYIGATIGLALVGGLLVLLIHRAGLVRQMAAVATMIPGGVGEVLLPFIYATPWIVWAMLAGGPTLVVYSARQRRVKLVEQDLPITLDLLATLAEVGLSLDSAIDRLLDAVPRNRPLPEELRAFQRDVLAGRARIEALRLLGRRVSVPWFSIFISAVVQAEQIGAGMADVLKVQAEDLRQRRKEQALAVAMATPVKLLLPMVVCFAPGIFVASLGPVFYEIFQFLDTFFK